jgi:hypothetical protein
MRTPPHPFRLSPAHPLHSSTLSCNSVNSAFTPTRLSSSRLTMWLVRGNFLQLIGSRWAPRHSAHLSQLVRSRWVRYWFSAAFRDSLGSSTVGHGDIIHPALRFIELRPIPLHSPSAHFFHFNPPLTTHINSAFPPSKSSDSVAHDAPRGCAAVLWLFGSGSSRAFKAPRVVYRSWCWL